MKYQCTRNSSVTVTASQAIVQGIAKNGGLFVPETLPSYTMEDLIAMKGQSYFQRAAKVVSDFLPEFTPEEIQECVTGAYGGGKFSGGHPAPVVSVNDGYPMNIMELWHGPTCAFKDMALQLLPHLLTHSLKKTKCDKTAVILVATSGDTGKAALEGFKDVDGTKMLVFYPENGVSPMQKRQMNTQEGGNVSVCAIEGNFDDAQTGVKKLFVDEAINKELNDNGMLFSSANSINWGRLLPQIVYYFSAYADLLEQGKIQPGDKINVVVPTGNFGNILAGYYACKMGLPVNKFICASNSNNVLTDFLKTGEYNRNRAFHATVSPSMDILISSNLERLLYDVTDHNSEKVAGWRQELSEKGVYKVDDETFKKITDAFDAGFCGDEDTLKTIRKVYDNAGYLCDTHTAVAVNVYEDYVERTGDKTPTVIVSTASPYKFASSVLSAVDDQYDDNMDEFQKVARLSKLTNTEVPAPIAHLEQKTIRFSNVCEKENMGHELLKMVGLE